jgi:hypothetical protein
MFCLNLSTPTCSCSCSGRLRMTCNPLLNSYFLKNVIFLAPLNDAISYNWHIKALEWALYLTENDWIWVPMLLQCLKPSTRGMYHLIWGSIYIHIHLNKKWWSAAVILLKSSTCILFPTCRFFDEVVGFVRKKQRFL